MEDIMKKSATPKATKKNVRTAADLAPKQDQNVNGGFVMRISKSSPE